MLSNRTYDETECRISGCTWTSGKYGIKKNGGNNWYIWWYDPVKGETERSSLRTPIFSVAIQRATDMINGLDPRYPGGDPIVYDIVKEFVGTFPEGHHRHRIWRMLEPTLKELASNLKVSRLGLEEVQVDIIKHILARGYVSSTTHQMMAGISSAVTWAATTECAPGVKRSKFHPKIIMNENIICEKFGVVKQKPDNYHPDLAGMVRLINALQNRPDVLRWLLVMLTFGCRVEAAAGATGAQLAWSQFALNPEGRPEYRNKRRPELPVAWSSLAEFRTWGEGPWIDVTAQQIGDVFRRVRKEIGLPRLKPSSIRDYVVTMLRHAHVTHGVRYIPEEHIMMWVGHKRDTIHHNYGEFRPEYHLRCRVATEAVLRDLDHRTGGAFFRQGSDKTPLQELSALEEVEHISGFWAVNSTAELPQETTIYLGPKQVKTGDLGPVRGSFRQVSDNKVRHPDGTIDALGTYGRTPLERRLADEGITILVSNGDAASENPSATYIVATGSHQVPAVRSGDLSKPVSNPPNHDTLNQYDIPAETDREYIENLREFEIEMTQEYDICTCEGERAIFDTLFQQKLFFAVMPVLMGMPAYENKLDVENWTEAEIDAYIEKKTRAA